MRYLVRRRYSKQQLDGSGRQGSQSAVIVTETSSKARELGAAQLGLPQSSVEVIEIGGSTEVIVGPERALTEEEAAEIFNQETAIIPGSWESL